MEISFEFRATGMDPGGEGVEAVRIRGGFFFIVAALMSLFLGKLV